MLYPIRLTLCAALFGLPMQIAQAAEVGRNDGYISVTVQRSALVECKYDLGRGGWPKFNATYVEKPWGTHTVLRIASGQTVSAKDAAWINSCADQKLGRGTQLAEKPTEQVSSICPKHAPVIYGGTRYCFKRR